MAANDSNPMVGPSAGDPTASKHTILMAGLSCDVYGLSEVALSPSTSSLTCLWLHHPRNGRKEDMAPFASRIITEWNQRQQKGSGSGSPSHDKGTSSSGSSRGLIAVAFDQRNHGGRLVDDRANQAWKKGNPMHAVDMFSGISGMVSDTSGLMDVVGGYVRMQAEELREGAGEEANWDVTVDQHLVLGVSLGGHSTWQALFAEERVSAGVVIVGCPDFMALMSNRASLSKLPTAGPSFLGSKHFPRDLVQACREHDPKGILFGANDIPQSLSQADEANIKRLLDVRIKGKKMLLCSGADDKLVPYAMSRPFLEFFEKAVKTWYKEGEVVLENRVYEGVGHSFSAGMVEDAVRFLLDEVANAPVSGVSRAGTFGEERSKI